MRKNILLSILLITMVFTCNAQLIQGTIKKGVAANEFEIWLKPDFNNSSEYLYQIGLPVAIPATVNPQPTGLNVTLDAGFVSSFGNNYTVTVNPVAHSTDNTDNYFNIVLIRGGAGASSAQTWTAGTEFKVLSASFSNTGGPMAQVKLADYQDGGSDGQGNFYTQSGSTYYVTSNSIGNFYASSGQSITGGDGAAGFAQTISPIILPVNLLRFSGSRNGSINTLQWSTTTEINCRGFEIERSVDGVNYISIGFVPANGNITTMAHYRFTDNSPAGVKQFYRLREVDINNNSRFSRVIIVTGTKPLSRTITKLYPNPASAFANLLIDSPSGDKLTLEVTDVFGKLLVQKFIQVEAGANSIPLEVSGFSAGSYYIKITDRSNNTSTAKFIKQ